MNLSNTATLAKAQLATTLAALDVLTARSARVRTRPGGRVRCSLARRTQLGATLTTLVEGLVRSGVAVRVGEGGVLFTPVLVDDKVFWNARQTHKVRETVEVQVTLA